MHAVIRTGGKQYRVAEGDVLRVEKLDAESGSKIELGEVLLVADGENVRVGAPLVEGGKVTAEVRAHGRGDKIDVIKFKRRKKYRRKYGHRQDYTEIRVTGISVGAKGTSKKAAAKPAKAAEDAGAGKADTAGKTKTASKKKSAATKKAAPKKAAPKKADSKKAADKKPAAKKASGTAQKTPAKKTAAAKKRAPAKKTSGGAKKPASGKKGGDKK